MKIECPIAINKKPPVQLEKMDSTVTAGTTANRAVDAEKTDD
jgi:hypothetical protein